MRRRHKRDEPNRQAYVQGEGINRWIPEAINTPYAVGAQGRLILIGKYRIQTRTYRWLKISARQQKCTSNGERLQARGAALRAACGARGRPGPREVRPRPDLP